MGDYVGLGGSDLFAFDKRVALDSNILYDNDTPSMTEYDEYVVYRKPPSETLGGDGPGVSHIPHKVSYDDKEGAGVLDMAFRRGRLVGYGVRPTCSGLDPRRLTAMGRKGGLRCAPCR